MRTPWSRLPLAAAATLLLLLALAAPAFSSDKPFAVVIANADGTTPSTLTASTEGTAKATYTNLTTQQQVGSSNLVVPSALRVVSASVSQGSATVSGNTIVLRNLNLAPGGSLTVTMRLVPDCTAQSLTWAAPVTKQANNYNGPPGNDLNLDSTQSRLTTIVTGGCALRFVSNAQPANARMTQTITAQAYTPTGPAVAVEVIDANGDRVATNGLPVTMAIGTNPGGGSLSGTATTTTTNGVATFSTLSIDKAGAGYTLQASSSSAASTTSTPFDVVEVGVACTEDVDCTGSLALSNTNSAFGGSSNVAVTAIQGPLVDTDAGFLTISRIGGPLDCSGYTELVASTDVFALDFSSPDREKRVVVTIDKKVMNAVSNNGASFLEGCFGAPFQFATKPGTPLEVNGSYVPGPYPAPEYKGLLPDCGGSAVLDDPNAAGVQGVTLSDAGAPCIEKRNKSGSGDGIITSRWPAGSGDPRMR
ncbi:MAG TPA: hypothetical protein VNT03_08420 [Baekduia sp.]|nr:hypothetical protein [Baekduia sp.]